MLEQLPEGKLPANLKVIKVGPGALGKVRVTTENVPHPTTGVTEKQRVLEITGGDAASQPLHTGAPKPTGLQHPYPHASASWAAKASERPA